VSVATVTGYDASIGGDNHAADRQPGAKDAKPLFVYECAVCDYYYVRRYHPTGNCCPACGARMGIA
jgi:rubrerythrin